MKLLVLLALSATPGPADSPVRGDLMLCEIVNRYVNIYGEKAAMDWAKSQKWSRAQIADARKCRKVS